MDKSDFDLLISSIKEAGRILRGEANPCREFNFPSPGATKSPATLAARAKTGSRAAFDRVLAKVPDRPPAPDDAMGTSSGQRPKTS